nr:hypothetical protein [Candidatus Hamiltonella defensa]
MISLATTVKRGLINTTGDERQMNRSGCTGKNTRYWPVLLDHYSHEHRPLNGLSTTLSGRPEVDAFVEYPAWPGKHLDPKTGEIQWPKAPRGE